MSWGLSSPRAQQLLDGTSVLVRLRWAGDCSLALLITSENFQAGIRKHKKLFIFSALLAWFAHILASQEREPKLPSLLPSSERTETCWQQRLAFKSIKVTWRLQHFLKPCLL